MTVEHCKSCLFYLGHDMGSCRRFPTYQTRSQNEWCGEFAEKAIAPPNGGAFLALPVVDVPQISKPRGRPRKND